jgi:hypothetical protein
MKRIMVGLGVASVLLCVAAPGWAEAAFAAPLPISTLTPPPPSFETCRPAGQQTICEGALTGTYGPDDNGFSCGSGAGAFEVFDQGTFREHAVRYYDQNGNLTRRFVQFLDFGAWSNQLTGSTLAYTQSNNITDVLAVPGDLGSAAETTTGEVNFTVPGAGTILLDAGRYVFGADGDLEFQAGPHGILDFFYGDASAFDAMCAALEA